jgi:fatty-acid desaturase
MAATLKRYNNLFHLFIVCGLLLLPLVLIAMPANFFDDTGVVVCLSRLVFDIDCYACGLTRAVQHAIHLDFSAAYEYNKLVVLVLPLLVLMWMKQLKIHWRKWNQSKDC